MPNLEKDWSKAVEYASSTASGDESGSRTGSGSNKNMSDDTVSLDTSIVIRAEEEVEDRNDNK